MKKLDIHINKSDGIGLFHDTRHDIQTLAYVCNELIDTVNELIDKINELERRK